MGEPKTKQRKPKSEHPAILDVQSSRRGLMVHVRLMPGTRYFEEFIRLRCAPDLLLLRVFPDGKEVSESMGAWDATRKHLWFIPMQSPDVDVVCVGDGSTPRTAALVAHMSAWRAWSVDPRLTPRADYESVKRLRVVPSKVQEMPEDVRFTGHDVVILAVHSHADLDETVAAVRARMSPEHPVPNLHVVAMECCVRMTLEGSAPDVQYQDWNVWSPQREVSVWKNLPWF